MSSLLFVSLASSKKLYSEPGDIPRWGGCQTWVFPGVNLLHSCYEILVNSESYKGERPLGLSISGCSLYFSLTASMLIHMANG